MCRLKVSALDTSGESYLVRDLLPARIVVCADGREQRAALRQRVGLGHSNRRLGRLQIGVVGDPLLDEFVQCGNGTAPTSAPECRRRREALGRARVRRAAAPPTEIAIDSRRRDGAPGV